LEGEVDGGADQEAEEEMGFHKRSKSGSMSKNRVNTGYWILNTEY
jgi:hypothetical protein